MRFSSHSIATTWKPSERSETLYEPVNERSVFSSPHVFANKALEGSLPTTSYISMAGISPEGTGRSQNFDSSPLPEAARHRISKRPYVWANDPSVVIMPEV